ncbi:signal peptide protein [Rhizobium yanglingense]|nr:signal peptide protein [Rhizobium yanglingense]
MGKMYRIALSKLLLIVRLAIIVSLAGYSLSNANAAMHGTAFPEFEQNASQITQHGDHDEVQMSGHGHSHDHAAGDKDGTKSVKKDCCSDFCGGFGIICDGLHVDEPVVTSIRHFVDDQQNYGELPPLHRPPNI